MNIQHKLVPATHEMYGHTVCMAQVGKYPTQLHFDEADKFNVQMGSSQFPWYAEGFHMPDGDIAIDAMAIRSDLTPCEGCYSKSNIFTNVFGKWVLTVVPCDLECDCCPES